MEKTDFRKSLEEINSSIPTPEKTDSFFKKVFIYSGPGVLVAVGYVDPGNWITSIQGGALYGYFLLSVILISSLIAMLLQFMCAKLGIVAGLDLAQATRLLVGKKTAITLWIIAELAIIATEIAEIIGSAIALNLLFDIPLMIGVIITILDVFLLLYLMKFGFRKIEAFVFTLILTIFIIFFYEVYLSSPNISEILNGFLPSSQIFTEKVDGKESALVIALGIIGATIMPHNLYLHSAIVQSRKIDRNNPEKIEEAMKYATIDSNIQLTFSFVINCLLLILGASIFFGSNVEHLGRFSQLYDSLKDETIIGPIASALLANLFAVALLASGQNSTITGTITGQVVMEGFINLRIPSWLRRLISRVIAIIPVIICILIWGENEAAVEKLLVYSQVFLSFALPVCIIPLLYMTSCKKWMGKFKNSIPIIMLAIISTVILLILNIQLIIETLALF